ncbi:hypothetical protein [Lentilactobacillus diolivorans]|nr:hypothetical protein [Lentilactobacillus diolivorans]GEP23270.1 hypothetical protein LDI01_08630 [Lentilactobacillus diolivorans]
MNRGMVDIKKQIKFLMLLLPSLIIGFILNQSSTTQAATDRSADSYYLNDSDTWTHYFYNKRTVKSHNAYIWNLKHTKRQHNLNNYKSTDWYVYSFYNKKKDGHTYKYYKVTNYNRSIVGMVYSKYLTISTTEPITSFADDSNYLNYIKTAQSQKLARGIMKMFPNAPLSLEASKFIASRAANNPADQTTYKEVINFSKVAYQTTVSQWGTTQSKLNKFQSKLNKIGYTQEKINSLHGYKLGLVVYDLSEDSFGGQIVSIHIGLVK